MCGLTTDQLDGDVGARQQRTDGVALRDVAGHLQHGDAHVAANAERDAEAEAAEERQLEARTAGTARRAAAPARHARPIHRATVSALGHAGLVVGLVQVVVLISCLLLVTDAARQTTRTDRPHKQER